MPSANKGIVTGRQVLGALLLFFGAVIGVNALMTWLAIRTLPGTDVASAYSASLAYKEEIKAAQQQNARHWTVVARAARQDHGVDVSLEARNSEGEPIEATFSVRLERPVDKRQDQVVTLAEVRRGIYVAQLADVPSGRWDLMIEAETDGRAVFRSRNRIWLD